MPCPFAAISKTRPATGIKKHSFFWAGIAAVLVFSSMTYQISSALFFVSLLLLIAFSTWLFRTRAGDAGRLDESSRESELRLGALLDTAVDGIITINEQGIIESVNGAAEKLFGYKKNELIGNNINMLMPEPYRSEHDEYVRHYVLTGERKVIGIGREVNGLRKDGSTFPFDLSVSEVNLRGRRIFTGFVHDISERKEAEKALRDSEERFRSTFENAAVGISHTDSAGHWLRFNQRLCDILGYSREELMRMSFREVTDDEEQRKDWRRYLEMWQGDIDQYRIEKQFVRRDGTRVWLDIQRSMQRGLEGHPEYAINIVQDISARKSLEERLRSATISATRAKVAAEQANTAKDQFLAVLSHELRTPLTPILAAVQLMQRNKSVPDTMQTYVEIIKRNLELEARLIDDLLDLTRIVRGKLSLEKRPVMLRDVLEQVRQVCGPDFQARKLHFGINLGNDSYLINADAARLQQVFWNLVKNSVKFTPDNGCIGISAIGENGNVVVEVSDSGIGIEQELLSKIFDAFEQGGQQTTRQFGGLGLGLAITKRIVELHGGEISAFSEGRGHGATIKVALPLLQEARLATQARESGAITAERHLHILLVEDHRDTAQMTKALLEGLGHKVITAGDAVTALDIAARNEFDLLISDLGLPDMSGFELMRELRKSGKSLKAIAVSGFGREEDVRRSKDAGFVEHLTKPFDFDTLHRTMGRLTAMD